MVANSIIIFDYPDLPAANALPRALQVGAELRAQFPDATVIQGTFGSTSQFLERLRDVSRSAYAEHARHQVWMVGMCGEIERLELNGLEGGGPPKTELFVVQLDPTPEQPFRLGFVSGQEILDAVKPPVSKTLVLVIDPSDEGPHLDLDICIRGTTQTHRQSRPRRPGDPIQTKTTGDIIYLTLTRVENSGWCSEYHERTVSKAREKGISGLSFPNNSTGLLTSALAQVKKRTWQSVVHIISTTIISTTAVPVVVLFETNNHAMLKMHKD